MVQQIATIHDRVLDIGTGTGRFIRAIESKMRVGIDISITMLMTAKERAKSGSAIHFVRADAEHLPFKGESFSLILCLDVLEHLPDPRACVKDVHRVMAAKGYLLVTTPNNPAGLHWRMAYRLGKVEGSKVQYHRKGGIIDEALLTRLVEKEHFEIMSVCKIIFVPLGPSRVLGFLERLEQPLMRTRLCRAAFLLVVVASSSRAKKLQVFR